MSSSSPNTGTGKTGKFKCDACGATFDSEAELQDHNLRQHGTQ